MTEVRVVPVFSSGTPDDEHEARRLLALVLGDDDPGVLVLDREAGVDLLSRLALAHEGCQDLATAGRLLLDGTSTHLVLGWTPGWAGVR